MTSHIVFVLLYEEEYTTNTDCVVQFSASHIISLRHRGVIDV